jgi:DNA-directed RNA polymerase specialized sigma24 family protein
MLQVVDVDEEESYRALVVRVCTGDAHAWHQLWQRLDPALHRLVRGFRMGRLSREPEERQVVVLEVITRLRADGHRRLRMFAEAAARDPQLSLLGWLKVVAHRVAIDVLRAHPNFTGEIRDADGKRHGGRWNDPHTLPPPSLLAGPRPPVTRDGTARQMLEHARVLLPERQYQALVLRLQGEPAADIARALALAGPAEAERMVRAALERLRRRFRTQAPEDRS